jgi:hypothetical protein
LQNLAGIDSDAMKHLRYVGSVAHQPAARDKTMVGVSRRYPVARCQRGKLPAPTNEECIGRDEQRIRMLAIKSSEGRVDLEDRTRIVGLDLEPQDGGGLLGVANCVPRDGSVGRIDEHGDTHGLRDQLMQQP